MKLVRIMGTVVSATCLLAACAGPMSDTPPTQTSDPRYLVGSLAALEASQSLSLSAEDPGTSLAIDENSPTSARAAMGAEVTVVVDDNGTPGDLTDDILTLTSTGAHWTGLDLSRVVVRHRKPVLSQLPLPGDSLVQSASETWYPNGDTSATPFADIAITTTWENHEGAIVLKAFRREGERIGFRHAVPQVLTIETSYDQGEEVKKEVRHYQSSVAPGNLLYLEIFERLVATGSTPASTKVSTFAPDGTLRQFRTIVRSDGIDSVRRFNAAGLLRETFTRIQTGDGWSVERTKYKSDGLTVKRQFSEVAVITSEGDTTHLVRTITTEGRSWQVTMDITVSGDTYLITKTDAAGGVRTWSAIKLDDGSWSLTENGVQTLIAGDDVV